MTIKVIDGNENRRRSQRKHIVYECCYCHQKFTDYGNLTRHKIYFHSSFIGNYCKYCKYPFPCSKDIREHICADKPVWKCFICGDHFSSEYSLSRHASKHQIKKMDNDFQCEICELEFERHSELRAHKNLHRWVESLESYQPFEIKVSKLIFQSVPPSDTESIDDEIDYVDAESNDVDMENGPLGNEEEMDDKMGLLASRCGKTSIESSVEISVESTDKTSAKTSTKTSVESTVESSTKASFHVLKKTTKCVIGSKEEKPMFDCPQCPKNYKLKLNLNRHLSKFHGIEPSSNTNNNTPSDPQNCLGKARKGKVRNGNFKCDYCDKTFIRQGNRTRHMKIHLME